MIDQMRFLWSNPKVLPLLLLAAGASLFSCQDGSSLPTPDVYQLEVPAHFPAPTIPDGKTLTAEKIALGRKLFFDPILSSDSTISCGSCHIQGKAFADNSRVSRGVENRPGTRNAPALINVVYGRSFFWDGSSPTLERQVLFPLESEFEMNSTVQQAIGRLQQHPEYPELFQAAFDEGLTANALTDAIAAFERTLISADAPFDRFRAGDSAAMTAAQYRGMDLFFGEKAECFHCHGGFNFTDELFHSNGLDQTPLDNGRWRVTGVESDRGTFKTPTLRNIEHTSPYMHDGRFDNLEEVIDHYASGGANDPNKSPLIRRFILSPAEKEDLIAFLLALSDPGFLVNPDFQE